ncbi:unnamed protein product [Phytomonas sp. Hart1]|nr:unnamed protein product [Phytomonas sp. Hart1]|eukprot:CCW70103.1 unnamed protein product [Phytomonas sp. isolate Hart1]
MEVAEAMFSIPKPIFVSQPQPPVLPSSGILEQPMSTPFIRPTSFQSAQLSVPKIEAPSLSTPAAIPVPVLSPAALTSTPIPLPSPTTAPPNDIPLFPPTDLSSMPRPKSEAEAIPGTSGHAVLPVLAPTLPTISRLPLFSAERPETSPLQGMAIHAREQAGDTVQGDQAKGPATMASGGPNYGGRVGPICPGYVMFGGAQYLSFFPFSACSRKGMNRLNPKLESSRENTNYLAELKRIQFMSDQLKVARRFLRLKGAEGKAIRRTDQVTVAPPQDDIQDTLPYESEIALTPIDLEKGTIWTLAWAGTPLQLQDALRKQDPESNTLDALGYVTLGRHQWGLKRNKDEYVLGLGMKATALQFAVVSGRLDNVILLLFNGAADCFVPHLFDILPKRVYNLLKNALKKHSIKKKPPAPLQVSSIPLQNNFSENT